jgi:hypothetical protein
MYGNVRKGQIHVFQVIQAFISSLHPSREKLIKTHSTKQWLIENPTVTDKGNSWGTVARGSLRRPS